MGEEKSQGRTTEARKTETEGESKMKVEAVNEEDVNPRKNTETQRDRAEPGQRSTQLPKQNKEQEAMEPEAM